MQNEINDKQYISLVRQTDVDMENETNMSYAQQHAYEESFLCNGISFANEFKRFSFVSN